MVEYIEAVKPYRVGMYCDDCKGEVEPTGTVLLSSPPKYPHKCSVCGVVRNYYDTYPYITYEVVPE